MRQPLAIARLQIFLCLGVFLSSCFARVEKLEKKVDGLTERINVQDEAIKRIADENKQQWARLNCKSDKVREFLKACEEQGDGAECSPRAIDGAMDFIDSQPYVSLYLRPNQSPHTMIALRRGQLVELIKFIYLFPTTRFLIIVQPRGEGGAFDAEARRAGDEISQYLRFSLRLPSNRPVLGPLILPCKTKTNWISHYGGRYDVAQNGEPPKKEERIRIWVFRSDC